MALRIAAGKVASLADLLAARNLSPRVGGVGIGDDDVPARRCAAERRQQFAEMVVARRASIAERELGAPTPSLPSSITLRVKPNAAPSQSIIFAASR